MTQTITSSAAGRTVEIAVAMQTERTINADGDIVTVAVDVPTIVVTVAVDGRTVASGYPEFRDGAHRLGKVQFTAERWAEIEAIVGTYKATREYRDGQARLEQRNRQYAAACAAHDRARSAMSVGETWQ